MDQLTTLIFEANLSFSALLLAVMGILVSLYLKAEHAKWKFRFKILLILCGATFFIGIAKCLLSLYCLVNGLGLIGTFEFNLIIALFVGELAVLAFTGLFLVLMLVI